MNSVPDKWDKPNGQCSQCGAPLNQYMVGGYKLHDGTYSTPANYKLPDGSYSSRITKKKEEIACQQLSFVL